MREKMILCFVYPTMADFEVTLACTFLMDDFQIVPVSYEKSPVRGMSGLWFSPQKTFQEAQKFLSNVEGLIIPGGKDRNIKPELTEIVQSLVREGKLVTAICAGPEFLAKIGVLEGRNYTTSLSADHYIEKGEEDPFNWKLYLDENVVHDENIITAKGNAFVDFAIEICDWFKLFKTEEEKNKLRKSFKGL